jgi:hypothetical protein
VRSITLWRPLKKNPWGVKGILISSIQIRPRQTEHGQKIVSILSDRLSMPGAMQSSLKQGSKSIKLPILPVRKSKSPNLIQKNPNLFLIEPFSIPNLAQVNFSKMKYSAAILAVLLTFTGNAVAYVGTIL